MRCDRQQSSFRVLCRRPRDWQRQLLLLFGDCIRPRCLRGTSQLTTQVNSYSDRFSSSPHLNCWLWMCRSVDVPFTAGSILAGIITQDPQARKARLVLGIRKSSKEHRKSSTKRLRTKKSWTIRCIWFTENPSRSKIIDCLTALLENGPCWRTGWFNKRVLSLLRVDP